MQIAAWTICALTIGAVLARPWRIPEWCWAVLGAAGLVAAGVVTPHRALAAVADGRDVYLFLAGILALAEVARTEGVFEWIAAHALRASGGSQRRLFGAVYVAGVAVTVLLSNDATVLLLTPAVLAVLARSGAQPLPYLYACAFVANAASFVLPISNPANLVVFRQLPSLWPWLNAFGLASVAAVLATFALLYLTQRQALRGRTGDGSRTVYLSPRGRLALWSVSASAALVAASAALGWNVGVAAFVLAAVSTLVVGFADFGAARAVLRHGPWSILPLVAGLFVLVEALERTGVLAWSRAFFRYASNLPPVQGNLLTGGVVTLADNVLNNLPAGLIARYTLHAAHSPNVAHAALVGVDLGPNLCVTGSLATVLWLVILRREGIAVSPLRFSAVGAVVLLPTLVLAMLLVR